MAVVKHNNVIIVDTSYLIFKSFYGYPHLNTGDTPTGAFFGFVKTIVRLRKEFNTDFFIFCCDLKDKTWRHLEFEEYKGGRPLPPPALSAQFPIVVDWVKKICKNTFASSGFEADDIIKTSVDRINADNLAENIFIYSSDRDLYQIFENNNNVSFISNNDLFDSKAFEAKYFVKPRQWVDYKSLVGDPSDNLKGVDKIGPKTAASILQQINSLDSIKEMVENNHILPIMEKFSEKDFRNKNHIEKIVESWNIVVHTKKLATLVTVPNIEFDFTADFTKGLIDLEKYKLNSVVKEINDILKKKNSQNQSQTLF
jgi:DNA polymerase I